MAKVYMVTEEEMLSLIDSLELKALREKNVIPKEQHPALDDLHRGFHFVAVRWVQAMGCSGVRR